MAVKEERKGRRRNKLVGKTVPCYVVTYQSVSYGEEMYDYKDFMIHPVEILGVFTVEEETEGFIKQYAQNEADGFYGDLDDDDPELDSKEGWQQKIIDHCSVEKVDLHVKVSDGEN